MLRYILLFILFFPILQVNGQVIDQSFDHKIMYQLTFVKDSTDRDKTATEFMELLINDSITVFRSHIRARIDSINMVTKQKHDAWTAAGSVGRFVYERLPQTNFNYSIYHEEGSILYVEKLQDQVTYLYEESEVPVWQLTSDTAKIGDFICQKAVSSWGNRIWEAWFTTKIPISYGPYKFNGLPGLIVLLKDKTNSWIFELVGISNDVKAVYLSDALLQNNYTKVKKVDFYNTKRYLLDNYFDINLSAGRTNYVDEQRKNDARAAYLLGAKTDNNWIELYP